MATYTSHYNLTKPEGTERVNIGIINQNMDTIDAQMYKNAQSIIANHGGMAILSNNNTHAAVSSGQYVYVYNHSSLAEGLYVANSAISTNGALSLSNLTVVSNGGLNHVYSTLNSKIPYTKLLTCGPVTSIYITNKSGNSKATFLILTGNTDVIMATAFANGPKITGSNSGGSITISDDNGRMKITSSEFYYATAQIISMFDFDASVT